MSARTPTASAAPEEPSQGTRPVPPAIGAADCPVEALYEDHFQQRQMASDMEALAGAQSPRPELAQAILPVLSLALPAHRTDEDQSLFPRLRMRAKPEDEIGPVLDRLEGEHVELRVLSETLKPMLVRLASGAVPEPAECEALRRFAQTKRRHLITENALVLPLARLRLTSGDKAEALAEMRARRVASTREAAITS
jgi:hypothetical protein